MAARRKMKSRREIMETEDYRVPEYGSREWRNFRKRQTAAVHRSYLSFKDKMREVRRLMRMRARKP